MRPLRLIPLLDTNLVYASVDASPSYQAARAAISA